jgi:hypothetical protein
VPHGVVGESSSSRTTSSSRPPRRPLVVDNPAHVRRWVTIGARNLGLPRRYDRRIVLTSSKLLAQYSAASLTGAYRRLLRTTAGADLNAVTHAYIRQATEFEREPVPKPEVIEHWQDVRVYQPSGAAATAARSGRSTTAPCAAMAAPRDTVFDVIAEPYLGRTPRALADEIEVLDRGSDMVLAAHRTPVGGGIVTTTVEAVWFDRPETVDFRLVLGPVPHVVDWSTPASSVRTSGCWGASGLTRLLPSGRQQSARRSIASGPKPNDARTPIPHTDDHLLNGAT